MKDQDMFVYASWMEKFGGFAKDMTLRDYFAAKAMQAMLTHPDESSVAPQVFAIAAYTMADEMLKARGQ